MTTSTKTDIANTLTHAVDNASNGIHKAIYKATDAARPAFDQLSVSAHHAVDKLAAAATQVSSSLDSTSHQVRDAHARLSAKCRTQVQAQPAAALGIAIATGFVLGWLLRKR